MCECVCYLLSHDNDQIAFQARGMNSRLASQGQTSTAAAIVLEKFKVSQAAPTAAIAPLLLLLLLPQFWTSPYHFYSFSRQIMSKSGATGRRRWQHHEQLLHRHRQQKEMKTKPPLLLSRLSTTLCIAPCV